MKRNTVVGGALCLRAPLSRSSEAMPDAEAPGRVPRRTAQPIYSMKRVTKTEMVVESLTLRPEGQTLP